MQKNFSKKNWKRYLPLAMGIAVVIGAVVVAMLFRQMFKIETTEPKKQIQQVTIIAPPPPPPPPPKEEIREPEVQEDIPEDLPEPAAVDDNSADAPAGEDLGVDAEGSAGGDGFGLVGKRGGRGILGGVGGYEQAVRNEINEAVIADRQLRHLDYVANITLRLSDNGEIETFNVDLVSGSAEAKAALESLLSKKRRISQPRPLEAASLIKLRVRSVI